MPVGRRSDPFSEISAGAMTEIRAQFGVLGARRTTVRSSVADTMGHAGRDRRRCVINHFWK
jgi:hypothetical protein